MSPELTIKNRLKREVAMDKLETVPLDAISIPKNHIRVQSIDEKAIKKLADWKNQGHTPINKFD